MAQGQFIQEGAAVDYTPGADVAAGTVVVIGDLVGITKRDIAAGVLGSIAVEGVFDLIKDSAVAITAGAKVYWDAVNSLTVATATGNKLIGKAIADAGVGTTEVRVRLSQ